MSPAAAVLPFSPCGLRTYERPVLYVHAQSDRNGLFMSLRRRNLSVNVFLYGRSAAKFFASHRSHGELWYRGFVILDSAFYCPCSSLWSFP